MILAALIGYTIGYGAAALARERWGHTALVPIPARLRFRSRS